MNAAELHQVSIAIEELRDTKHRVRALIDFDKIGETQRNLAEALHHLVMASAAVRRVEDTDGY